MIKPDELVDNLDGLTFENVEEELKKLKIIEDNYESDDELQVREREREKDSLNFIIFSYMI